MPAMKQIYESDLAELEQLLPALMDATMAHMTNADRIKWRRAQAILTGVRWNYGPPASVTVIDAAGGGPE